MESVQPITVQTFSGNDGGVSDSLAMALEMLRKFYDCKFNDFDRFVLSNPFTVIQGGPSWKQVLSCIQETQRLKLCMHRFAHTSCMNATHRVAKVLRLTTDLLGDLLRSKSKLKVIHLFRDPRAILNSRIVTPWYPLDNTTTSVIDNAKALCTKMLKDSIDGKTLLKIYPERFKFIYYEDLNDNLFEKVKRLYAYLGMSLDEKRFPKEVINSLLNPSKSEPDTRKNTISWWRTSLQWNIVKEIDMVCADVYRELGYKAFRNVEEYRDMSFKSIEIPAEYLI